MPQDRIPFGPQQATGLDELAGGGREAFNVVMDSLGSVRRRPGTALWSTVLVDARGIDALHATVDGEVFALSASPPNRTIYKVTPTGRLALPGVGVGGMRRPVIAETESILAIAAGSDMVKLVLATETSSLLGGSPPESSHVIAQSTRLLANDVASADKTKVYFSNQALGSSYAGFEQWGVLVGGGFFTAEARPDPVLALAENTNEVFVWGTTTLQVYGPDAVFVFAPLSTREHGLSAPYSVVKVDMAFAWLDHRRRFVLGDGRAMEVISQPIQRALDELTKVSDCFGYRVAIGPTDAIVWSFPTDGRTFVYQTGVGWGQWLDPVTSSGLPSPVQSATHDPTTNATIVGVEAGVLLTYQTGLTTDSGNPILSRVTTGFENRKTDSRKHCQKVRLAMRRGETAATTGPHAWLRWRDRPGAWTDEVPVDLGATTDTEVVVEFPSLGVYRRRQWQFEFSGTDDLVLTSATEDFEPLGD